MSICLWEMNSIIKVAPGPNKRDTQSNKMYLLIITRAFQGYMTCLCRLMSYCIAWKLPVLQGGLGPTSVRPHKFLSASGGRTDIMSNTDGPTPSVADSTLLCTAFLPIVETNYCLGLFKEIYTQLQQMVYSLVPGLGCVWVLVFPRFWLIFGEGHTWTWSCREVTVSQLDP